MSDLGWQLSTASVLFHEAILIAVVDAAAPDLSAIFADLTREMNKVVSRYDDQQLAAISDYVERTIEVLRAQTAKLAEQP